MIRVNGVNIVATLFPDGTSQVWKLPESIFRRESFTVEWRFDTEAEFMHLAQLKNLLDIYNVDITLKLPYLPYGRQDKEIDNKATFALRTFASLLNSLKFDEVVICDPHSNISLSLISNSRAIYPTDILYNIMSITKTDLICYPDHGAVTKYVDIYKIFPHLEGEKIRDQETGKILKYSVKSSHDNRITPTGNSILIVDDICDGGMTFVLLADELYKAGAKEVNLFVTHGIFSRGLEPLTDAGIKNVFTSDGEVGEFQGNIFYRRMKNEKT